MAATTTVRVRPATREAIARLSELRGVPAADLLGELVARAEEDALLAAMNDDFRDLRADPARWSRIEAERATWERTLLDGLAGR